MNHINDNLVYKAREFRQEILANSTETFKSHNIMVLPNECIIKILSVLDTTQDLLKCRLINKRLLNIIDDTPLLVRKFFDYYQAQINPGLSVSYYNLELRNWLKNFDTSDNEIIKYLDKKINNIYFKQILFFTIAKVMLKTKKFTYKKIATIEHLSEINHVCFHANILVTASNDAIAKVWQFKNNIWQKLTVLTHENEITHTMFSPSGCHLFTFSKVEIKIWEIVDNSFDCKKVIKNCHECNIHFRNDSKRFFMKIQNKAIKILDLIDNNWVEVLVIDKLSNFFDPLHSEFKQDILVEDNIKNDPWLKFILQRYCMTKAARGSYAYDRDEFQDKIINMVHGKSYFSNNLVSLSQELPVKIICSSADMKLIYMNSISNYNYNCIILEHTKKEWKVKIKFHESTADGCFSPDNKRLISMNLHKATIWNITGNTATKEACLPNVCSAKFSHDSVHIITASSVDNLTQILGFIDQSWQVKTTINLGGSDFHHTQRAYFNNDSRFIAAISSKNSMKILEINGVDNTTISPIKTIDHTSTVTAVTTLSPIKNIYLSSNVIITIDEDKNAQVWRLVSGLWSQQQVFLMDTENITNIMFSPNGLHLIIFYELKIKMLRLTDNKWQDQIEIEIKICNNIHMYFRKDSKRFFLKIRHQPIKIFDLINNNWIQVSTINNTAEIFDPKENTFHKNISLENNIKNDEWLKFILQRYCLIQAAKGVYGYNANFRRSNRPNNDDKEFQNKIKDMVHGGTHLASSYKTPVETVRYSSDMKLIYIGTIAGCTILEYINTDWQVKVKFKGDIDNACFSCDNKKIITILGYSKNIYNANIWDITGDKAKHESCLRNVYSANFSFDGKYIVTISSTEETAKIWEFIDQTWQVKMIVNHNNQEADCFNSIQRIKYAYLSDDNKFITTIAADKTLKTSDIQFLLEDR